MVDIRMPRDIEAGEYGSATGRTILVEADGYVPPSRRSKPSGADLYYHVRADGEGIDVLAEYCNPSKYAVAVDKIDARRIEIRHNSCFARHYTIFEKDGFVYYLYGDRSQPMSDDGRKEVTHERFGRLSMKEVERIRRLLKDMVAAGESRGTVDPIIDYLKAYETSRIGELSGDMAGRPSCEASEAAHCKYANPVIELGDTGVNEKDRFFYWYKMEDGTENVIVSRDFNLSSKTSSSARRYNVQMVWEPYRNLMFTLHHRDRGIARIEIDVLGNITPVFGSDQDLEFLRGVLMSWAGLDVRFVGCFDKWGDGSPADPALSLVPDAKCDARDERYYRKTIGWRRTPQRIPSLENRNRESNAEEGELPNDEISWIIDGNFPYLEGVYHYLHMNPELAHDEKNASALLAREFSGLGFDVTTDFAGDGVVAVLENGDGPTTMIRAEMDALPVEEETDVPYRSGVPGVMHACGHDVHMSVLLGAAYALTELSDRWHGTLILVGQPAEETGEGARDMIEAGLFEFFPRPDRVLSMHASASKPAGSLTYRKGYSLANVDYVDVVFKGPGGHGAMPGVVSNPIDLASRFDMELRAFVGEVNKTEPAVVSVGSFHGGAGHNVIPREAHLQMTSRSYGADVRRDLEDGIKQIATSIADAAGAPRPEVVYRKGVPSLYNDPDLVERLVPVFEGIVDEGNAFETSSKMFGDDFGYYGHETEIPVFQIGLGSQPPDVDPKKWPQIHSPKYLPQFEEAFTVGVLTMTGAVIELHRGE